MSSLESSPAAASTPTPVKAEEPICAMHRGADLRGEQNRQRAKDRYYFRIGINPETGKSIKITD